MATVVQNGVRFSQSAVLGTGRKLEFVRFQKTVILGGGRERNEVHGPDSVEGRRIGVQSLEYINDPDIGEGVLFVDGQKRTRFVPASNVNEVLFASEK
jgi:hypothetical protein